MKIHDQIDLIERDILNKYGILYDYPHGSDRS